MLLDVTGILFAAQLVVLLTIGPYADYGNWRPWIMISEFQSRRQSESELRQNTFEVVAYGGDYSWPDDFVHLPVCHVWHQ